MRLPVLFLAILVAVMNFFAGTLVSSRDSANIASSDTAQYRQTLDNAGWQVRCIQKILWFNSLVWINGLVHNTRVSHEFTILEFTILFTILV
jgi:hypothetical protein